MAGDMGRTPPYDNHTSTASLVFSIFYPFTNQELFTTQNAQQQSIKYHLVVTNIAMEAMAHRNR